MENSAEMSQIEELLKQVAWFLVTLNGVGYNCLISIEWSRNYVVENIKFINILFLLEPISWEPFKLGPQRVEEVIMPR